MKSSFPYEPLTLGPSDSNTTAWEPHRLSLLRALGSVQIFARQRSSQGARQGGKSTIRFGQPRPVPTLMNSSGKSFQSNLDCTDRVEARDELKSQFAKIRICLGHADARTPTDRM